VTPTNSQTDSATGSAPAKVPTPQPPAHDVAPAPPDQAPVRGVADLKGLIRRAADGDDAALRRLLAPFIGSDETLLLHEITAKMGLFTTYDFAFLTNRRVGDLEVTPFTGGLNVEVAYLDKIDAFAVIQPAFPISLRVLMFLLYAAPPVFFLAPGFAAGGGSLLLAGIAATALWLPLTWKAINPTLRRLFLRFKKSGLFLKLTGSMSGTLIFADRNKLAILNRLATGIGEARRKLIYG